MKPTYESPLASRYASKTMLHLFSPDMRYETWRRLWVALARAEHTLGLPITQAQVDELAAHVSPIDYDVVAAREKEVRHDVMAHIYAYGLDAPAGLTNYQVLWAWQAAENTAEFIGASSLAELRRGLAEELLRHYLARAQDRPAIVITAETTYDDLKAENIRTEN